MHALSLNDAKKPNRDLREESLATTVKHKTQLVLTYVSFMHNTCTCTFQLIFLFLFQIRGTADRKYLASAKKMSDRYKKRHNTRSFSLGEKVSLRIPRIDRASSDLSRLPCVIVDIAGEDQSLYRLRYALRS